MTVSGVNENKHNSGDLNKV